MADFQINSLKLKLFTGKGAQSALKAYFWYFRYAEITFY